MEKWVITEPDRSATSGKCNERIEKSSNKKKRSPERKNPIRSGENVNRDGRGPWACERKGRIYPAVRFKVVKINVARLNL